MSQSSHKDQIQETIFGIVEQMLDQPASAATDAYWRELAKGLLIRAKEAERRILMPCWKCAARQDGGSA